MNSWRLLNLALAVLVTIGLTMAPLTMPSIAAHSKPAGMNDMSMAADMPCCPDDHNSKDCADCPLVAICILKTVQAGPVLTAALPVRHAIPDGPFASRRRARRRPRASTPRPSSPKPGLTGA